MKIKSAILPAALCFLAASCGGKAGKTTVLNGVFTESAPATVMIEVPGSDAVKVDVVDNKFTAEIPANVYAMTMVSCDNGIKTHIISDGTVLDLVYDNRAATVTSQNPKASVQARSEEYKIAVNAIRTKYRELADGVVNEAVIDSLYDCFDEELITLYKKTFKENKKNILAVTALDNLQYDLEPDELSEMIDDLDEEVLSNPIVAKIKSVIDQKTGTAEGKKFTDFEVDGDKLSNYVGKGKYVLVDFWASWCNPCKGEIPNLKEIYSKYAGEDFDMLSVAVWDKPQASIDTAKAYGINWSHMVNAQTIPTEIYGIQGIPHIILFSPDGTILKRNLRGKAIEEEISKYVKAKK